jgi:hypothetical protein
MAAMSYCECDYPEPSQARLEGGLALCHVCGLPFECEFSGDTPHPATQVHVDYMVCDDHLHIAVSNVFDRR